MFGKPAKADGPPKPAPGDPPYITAEEALAITCGKKLRLRPTWPTEGQQGCGPEVEVVGISNNHHSQTNRMLLVRDKRDRFAQLDAAWFMVEPWMNPFYEPPIPSTSK